MPCNSDHLEPTARESYNQATAALFLHVLEKTNWMASNTIKGLAAARKLKAEAQKTADHIYASSDYTAPLCGLLRALKAEQINTFNATVYDAKNRTSRQLADWWEDHCQQDDRRYDKAAAPAVQEITLITAYLDTLHTRLQQRAVPEDNIPALRKELESLYKIITAPKPKP